MWFSLKQWTDATVNWRFMLHHFSLANIPKLSRNGIVLFCKKSISRQSLKQCQCIPFSRVQMTFITVSHFSTNNSNLPNLTTKKNWNNKTRTWPLDWRHTAELRAEWPNEGLHNAACLNKGRHVYLLAGALTCPDSLTTSWVRACKHGLHCVSSSTSHPI